MITLEQRKRGQDSYATVARARVEHGIRSPQYAEALAMHAEVVKESMRQARDDGRHECA